MKGEFDYKEYWDEESFKRKREYGDHTDFYNFNKGSRVIDVGGGNGQLSNFFGLKDVLLIDISESGLKLARERFNFKTKKVDLRLDWNIKKGYFDYAICNEVLEHLDVPGEVLRKINIILKDGGILYCSVPNMKPDGTHHKIRTHFRFMKGILESEGFRIEEVLIVPRYIESNYSDIKTEKSLIKKGLIFIGVTLKHITTKNSRRILINIFPSLLGRFYHFKVIKLNK